MSMTETILIEWAEASFRRLSVPVRTQKHLLSVPDRVLRRLELLFPADAQEQQGALYWMGEEGDEDDAALLACIPAASILCPLSVYASERQKLFSRVGHTNSALQEPSLSEYLKKVAAVILPGIGGPLRDLLDSSQVGRSQWLDRDTAPLISLQQEAETASRRLQYLFPASVQDYEATLRWFIESGSVTELGLLFAVPPPTGVSNEIERIHQLAQDRILDRLVNSTAPNSQESKLDNLVSFGIALRSTLGPRGSVTGSAARRISIESATKLCESIAIPSVHRNDLVLVLGEWGGDQDTVFLDGALRSEMAAGVDDDYQVYLVSALSNIGGPDAIEVLLRAAEEGSKQVRLVALSGLESLATVGAIALTEYSEPATINSEQMREAYLDLAERLRGLTGESNTPPYVRHKASELLDTILISLNPA